MKHIFKIVSVLLVLLAILVFSFFIFRNIFVKKALVKTIEERMGIKITISDLDISLTGARLWIEGLTIYNPEGFDKKELAYVAEVELLCDVYEILFQKKNHFKYVFIDLERIQIIKNKNEELNVKKFPLYGKTDPTHKNPVVIDILSLRVQDIYYLDQTQQPAEVQRYNVNLKDIAFREVDGFGEIYNAVLGQAISNTKVAKTLDMTVGQFSENLKGITILTGKTAKDAVKGVARIPLFFQKKQPPSPPQNIQ